jgi:predicted ATPase
MYFSNVRIKNYKGYRDSARLDLDTGINIVVGKNNSGKTALLEALSLRFAVNPHRSILTMPTSSRIPLPTSIVDFTFNLTRDEVIDLLIPAQGNTEFRLPLPASSDPVWKELKLKQFDDSAATQFGEWFFSHDAYTFRMEREAFGSGKEGNWHIADDPYIYPSFERASEHNGTSCHYCNFMVRPYERDFSFSGHITVSGGGNKYSDDFILRMGRRLNRYVYRFEAERFPSGPVELGNDHTLAPDARNLAEVINLLQGNLDQFAEFNRLVRQVLPDIKQVGTRKLGGGNQGEVIVWNDERAISRNELAFSLKESGAGIGQVLAILYEMQTAREPQTIIIDEPQGLLHPGAVRKLIEILRRYTKAKHQLIIATHSPTVITSADPITITLVRQEGAESVFEKVNVREAEQQQKYLWAIGARLSDVFGYDRVLWVEGETEEVCFPIILRELTDESLLGTAILRVQHTGDFNRKDSKNVIAIYERLSQLEGGLVPPLVGFVFDREDRSERDLEDLKRQSRGRMHFTTKRLYENYLLNPAGIAAVVNSIEGFSKRRISEQRVRKWLDLKKQDAKYFRPFGIPSEGSWTDMVHGALLLRDLFSELSKGLVSYDKTEHSRMLTEWVVNDAPDDLRELSDLLINVLNLSPQTDASDSR